MTFERASSHDFALSCLLAESNQSVHGEYSGCLTLKFLGSDRTVTSSLSFEVAIAVLTAAWDACAAAAGRFDEGARGDFVGASDMLGLRSYGKRVGRGRSQKVEERSTREKKGGRHGRSRGGVGGLVWL